MSEGPWKPPAKRRDSRASSAEPLARRLSAFALWLLVINGIVGAGIFGLPTGAARLAGDFSPWIFVICAALMLPVMLAFAELASHFDGTGGPQRYVSSVFGAFAGFQAGWAFYVARLTASSANAVLLVSTLGRFWPAVDEPGVRLAILFAVCAALTAVTVIGTRHAMGSLGVLTVLKLAPLAALVAAGLLQVPDAMLASVRTAPPPDVDLGAAVLLVFYAFVGFESGLVPAGEAVNPRRDMPRALVAAIAVVSVLYFALQAVAVAVLPELASAERPLVDAGDALFGPTGVLAMTVAVAASVGGNLAGAFFSTPRITYALALDRRLPGFFAAVPMRLGTPAVSIAVYGAAAFLLAAAGSFVWLASLSVLTRVLIYLGCITALPSLRRRASGVPGEFRLPGGLLIPALAAIVCVGLLTQVKPWDVLAVALLLAVGSVLYVVARLDDRT